jgi:hypothetical protein
MTDLSPAAEAVLNAVTLKRYDVPYFACPRSIDQIKSDVAAALWAVADHVAPFPGRYPMNEYMEGFRDAKQSVHHQLLAIATELEGVSD